MSLEAVAKELRAHIEIPESKFERGGYRFHFAKFEPLMLSFYIMRRGAYWTLDVRHDAVGLPPFTNFEKQRYIDVIGAHPDRVVKQQLGEAAFWDGVWEVVPAFRVNWVETPTPFERLTGWPAEDENQNVLWGAYVDFFGAITVTIGPDQRGGFETHREAELDAVRRILDSQSK